MQYLERVISNIIHGNLAYQFSWMLALALPFALIKGRWVERAIAIGLIAACHASTLIRAADPPIHELMNAMSVLDVCTFAFVLPFALWSDRYWPMWLLGAFAMLVLIDSVLLMQTSPNLAVFNNSSALWTDVALMIIGVGTYVEGMRRPKTQLPKLQLVFGPTP